MLGKFDGAPAVRKLSAQSAALGPGSKLGARGRFVVERLLAEGGMGSVYKVRDTRLERDAVAALLLTRIHLLMNAERPLRFYNQSHQPNNGSGIAELLCSTLPCRP